jgi:hypothetical protein
MVVHTNNHRIQEVEIRRIKVKKPAWAKVRGSNINKQARHTCDSSYARGIGRWSAVQGGPGQKLRDLI